MAAIGRFHCITHFAGSVLAISRSPKFLCSQSREAFSQVSLYLIKKHSLRARFAKEQASEEHKTETNK